VAFGALLSACAGMHVPMETDVETFAAPNWRRHARAAKDAQVVPTFMLKHDAEAVREFESLFYAVSTPGNPLYGKHLTKEEVAEKLPVVDGAADIVLSTLKEHGVTQVEVFSDMIKASMSVETAEKLFSTEFYEFEHSNGVKVIRVGSEYGVPEELHGMLYHVADLVQLPALDRVKLVDTPEDSKFLDGFLNVC